MSRYSIISCANNLFPYFNEEEVLPRRKRPWFSQHYVVAFIHNSFSRFLDFSCVIFAMNFRGNYNKPRCEKSLDL